MSTAEIERTFYVERVPEQFNETLSRQRAAAAGNPDAARVLEEMEAVRTAIVVRVQGEAGSAAYSYSLERGRMESVERAERKPFLTLEHRREDFEAIRRACGDSLLGFLGALSGQREELRLTAQRVRSLRSLEAVIELEVRGPSGFSLRASFGSAPSTAEPRARIRLDQSVYEALRDRIVQCSNIAQTFQFV